MMRIRTAIAVYALGLLAAVPIAAQEAAPDPLAAPNTGDWTSGAYKYDGAGNIDLNVTAAPPAVEVLSATRLGNGNIVLQCRGVPYEANTIQASPDLATAFMPIDSVVADATGAFQYEDHNADNFTTRFYKVVFP